MHHTTLSVLPARRRYGFTSPKLAACFAALVLTSAPWADAQTTPYVLTADFSATNLNLWGSGTSSTTTFDKFVGVTWDTTSTFGGISSHWYGDYGLEATVHTDGKIGFDVFFKSNGGSVNLNLPNTLTLNLPDLTGPGPADILVNQNRALTAGETDRIQSTFPTVEFSVDAKFQINASVKATAAFYDSVSGSLSLTDVRHELELTDPIFALINPFDITLPIVKYNVNNDHKIELLGGLFGLAKKDLGTGFTYPLNTDTLLPGIGYFLPTKVEYGNISVAAIANLDARSGSATTVTNTQSQVISVRADLIGLATLADGLPLNPFDPRIKIPGTPISAEIELLSVDAGISLGLQQTLKLTSNSYLILTSNMPVQYEVPNATGSGTHLTGFVTQWYFPLPEDGSDLTIHIHDKPSDPAFQIFPSVQVRPTVANTLNLLASPTFHFEAFKVGLSVWGIGGGIGPIYTYDTTGNPVLSFNIFNSLNDYSQSPFFSGDIRSLTSLVNPGAGGGGDFTVPAGSQLLMADAPTGSYHLPLVAGALTITDSGFDNLDLMEISGLLKINGNATGYSTADSRGLLVDNTGTFIVEAGSTFEDLGTTDTNFVYLTDANGKRVPGFVDANGNIPTGTFVLGGVLTYHGADVATIGANASLRLVGSSFVPGPHLRNGSADALAHLSRVDGTLWLDGVDETTDQNLQLEGNLILRAGANFTSAGLSGTTGYADLGAGSVLDITGGAFGYLSAGGVLSNLTLSLGDQTGGAQLRYSGPAVAENGADLVFIGVRPANGYLARDTGGQVFADALSGLALNSGTLSLLYGATQNVTGGLVNTGVLFVRDAGSALTTGGTLTNNGVLIVDTGTVTAAGFANANSLSIANGGILHAGALADRDSNGVLGGGGWLINGTLDYTGGYLTGLGANTTLVLNGAGAAITNGGLANPLAQFATNAGTLGVINGATFDASGASLANPGLLQLTGAGSTLLTRGFASQSGELQLGLGTTLDTTGGAAALASYWTTHGNTSLPVNGSGQLSGGTWTVAGDLIYTGPALTGVAAGTTLTLARTGADTSITDPALDLNSGSEAFVHKTSGASPVTTTDLGSFNQIDGVFALNSFANFSTDQSLVIGASGRLTVAPRATLQVTGPALAIAAGGTLDLQGNLILAGSPSTTTTLALPDGFAFAGSSGGGEVQLGRITYDGTNYSRTGTGAIASLGEWTNANYLIRGAGTLSGTTFLNNGRIYATEGTLALAPSSGAFINTGYLGSVSNGTLTLSGLTVTNQGTVGADTIYGLFDINAGANLTNTTVAGGDLYVGPGASLLLSNATLSLRSLTSLGTIEVAAGTTNSFGAELKSLPGTSLLLHAGATLVLDPNQPFVNRGLITLESGATLTGAPLSNDGTFSIGAGGVTSLSGLANLSAGNLNVVNGGNLQLTDATFTNAGVLTLAGENPATASNTFATLTLGQSVTLSGGGIVQLGGYATSTPATDANGNAYTVKVVDWGTPGTPAGSGLVTGLHAGDTLTNVDNTIQGRGNLGNGLLTIVNGPGGTIRSLGTSIGGVLDLDTGAGGFRNQGTLLVDTDTTLRISGGPFLSLSNGAIVEGSYIIGGTFQLPGVTDFDTSVPFVFNSPDSRIVDGLGTTIRIGNILAGGGLTVSGGAVFQPATTAGLHFSNAGLLTANPGGLVQITGGYFDNYNGATHTLTGGRFVVNDGTLSFTGADIRTNAADITLGGAGGLFVDDANQSALRNFSLNSAAGQLTFNQGLIFTLGSTAPFLTNLGTLTVAGNSNVTVPGTIGNFANADATGAGLVVVQAGSTLRLGTPLATGFTAPGDATYGAGRYILGGTLQLDTPFSTLTTDLYTWGNGRITDSSSALSTFSTLGSTGTITVANGTFDLSANSFTNNSLIQVGSATARDYANTVQSSAGTLAFHGSSLSGPGTLRLYSTADAASAVLFDHSVVLNSRIEGNGELHVQNAANTFTVGSAGTLAVTGTGNTVSLIFDQGGSFTNQGQVLVGPGGNTLSITGGNVAPDNQVTTPVPGYPGSWALSGKWDIAGTLLMESQHTIDTITAGSTLTLRNGYNLVARQFSGDLPVDHQLVRLATNAGSLNLYDTTYGYTSGGGSITNSGTITLDHSTFSSLMSVNNTAAGLLRITGSTVNYGITGFGDVHYFGPDASTVTGPTSYIGRTIIEDGATLVVNNGAGLGAYYLNIAGNQADSIVLGAGSTLHLLTPVTLDSSRGLTYANGAVITADASWTIPYGLYGTGNLTLNGTFATSLRGGAGDLTLNGNLNLGTLNGSDGVNGALNGSGTITTPNVFAVSGDGNFTGQVNGTGPHAGVTIGNGGSTGSLNANFNGMSQVTFNRSGALAYTSFINDGASVTVTGGLDLTFSQDQAYTGSTTITNGSSLTLGGALANYADITNNGRLTFAQTSSLTLGALAGTGLFVWDNPGTVILTSLATYSRFELDQGTLQIGDGGAYAGSLDGLALNGTLAFNSSGNLSVNAATLSGPGGLEQVGTGNLTLGPGQTYTGATFVGRGSSLQTAGGGTLTIGADSSLGTAPVAFTAGQLTIDNGTLATVSPVTLAATRGVTVADGGATFAGDLTIPTPLGGTGAVTKTGSGTTLSLVIGGVINRDLTVSGGTLDLSNGGGSSIFASNLGGASAATVRFSGAGTTTFGTATTFAGNIVVASGTTLDMGSGSIANSFEDQGTVIFNRGTTAAMPFGPGVVAVDVSTPLALTASLYGNFTGSLDLRGGVTVVDALDAVLVNPASLNAGAVTFDGGTLRQTGSGGTGVNQGLLINASIGTIDLPDVSSTFTVGGPVGGSGDLHVTGLGTLQFDAGGTVANNLTFTGANLTANNGTDLTFSGQLTSDSLVFVNTGLAKVVVTGAAFLHDVTIASGTLQFGDGGTTGSLGANGGGSLAITALAGGSLAFARSDDLTFTTALTGAGGLTQAGPGTLTINSAQAYTGATKVTGGTLRVADGASFAGDLVTNSTLEFQAGASVNDAYANLIGGSGGVAKTGDGTVTLSAANTYAGPTTVDAGTLILTGANTGTGGGSIAGGATLRLDDAAGAAGGIFANSGTLELARTDSYSLALATTGTGTIVKSGGGDAYLTLAPASANSISIFAGGFGYDFSGTGTLDGTISGPGTLLKAGTGTLILTANNGSSNGARVTGGTLQLGNGGTTGSLYGPLSVASGATLAYNRSDTIGLGDALGGDGAFSQRGTGKVILTADNTYTGGTSVFAGSTLQLGSGGTAGSILGNVANDGLLVFNRHDDYTFAGNTSGSGTLQQSGYGLLTLTGLHTATGGAIIDAGSSLALATSATLTGPIANSGNLTILTDASDQTGRELPVSVTGTGGLTVDGGGGLRITGDLTYSGLTTITGGSTLRLVNDQTSTLTNALAGNGTFIKLGDGTLTLTADSDAFTGTVRVSQGTLQLGNGGTTGSIGGSVTAVDLQGGTLAIDHSDPITISSVISGGGGLSQLGSGRLTLTNDNTFLGDVHVGGGAQLQLGLGGATGSVIGHLDVDGLLLDTRSGRWNINLGLTGVGTISKVLTGDSSANVISIAGGVGYPINFTGDVLFNGGTVQLNNDGTMGSFHAATLQVVGGANVALVGDTGSIHTINNGTITLGNGGTTGSLGGDITGGGTLAFNRSDTFTYNGVIGGGGLRQVGPGTTVFANGNSVFTGNVQVDAGTLVLDTLVGGTVVNNGTLRIDYGRLDDGSSISGTGNVVTASAGTTALPSDVTYTGQTDIAGGVLEFSPAGGTTTLAGLVTGPGGLRIATAGTLVLASGGTFTGPTTLVYDNPAQTGPTLQIGGSFASSASGFGTIEFNNASAATASGDLSGALELVKSGAGTLTLTGQNTHQGQTRVDGGTLALGANNALSPDSPFFISNVAGALLDLAGYNATLPTLDGGGSTGGNIDLGSGRLTVSPHQSSGLPLDSAYAGNIRGSGGLTMDGNGTLTLTGQNTYTGGTTLAQGTLAVGSSSLGLGTVLFSGGSLTVLGNMTFDSARPIVLTGYGGGVSVADGANVTVNSVITGSGDFGKFGAGNLLLNAAPANSGQVYISSGTLTLGGAGILSPGQALITDGYLDLNGQNWNSALDVHGNGGVANSGAAAVTVSGTLDTWGHLSARSTGGGLNLTGPIASNSGPVALGADGAGRIALGATPAVNIASITVEQAILGLQSPGSFVALTGIQAVNGAQLELTGGSSLPALTYLLFHGGNASGDAGGLQNIAAGTSTRVDVTQTSAATLSFYTPNPTPGSAAFLLGGAGDLTLSGHADGNADIAKVGAGRLTLEGNYADWSGGFDVRAGTLALDAATLQNRSLKLAAGGSIDFGTVTDLALSSLAGDGSLGLGATNLTLNSPANFNFTGAVNTTGTLGKIGAGTGGLGAVTAGSVTVDEGSLTINGLLTAASLTVHGGAAVVSGSVTPGTLLKLDSLTGGALSVNAASVTADAGATFTGNVDTNGSLQLLNQAADLTANSGSITLRDGGSLSDANFVHGTISSLTSNSGTLRGLNGSSLSLGAGFTNTGTLMVSGASSDLSAGVGSATTITQAAGSLTVGAGATVTVRHLNIIGGAMVLDGVMQNFSGAPTLTLSGGSLSGSGQIFRGNLVLNGGTFSPGNSPGTFGVQQGDATFAGGGTYRFEINNATGAAGTNWDLLSVGLIDPAHPSGGHLNLTATSGNKFTLLLVSLLPDNSAGSVINFNPTTSYAYTFASASEGIVGFNAAAFTVNTSGFANAYNGSWSVAQSGTNLNLVYTAIPEPSACAALAGLAGLGLAFVRRRRRTT